MLNVLNTLNLLATGLLAASAIACQRKNGKIEVTWQGLFVGLAASVCFVSLASMVLLEWGAFRHRYLQWTAGAINGVSGIYLVVSIARRRLSLRLDNLKLGGWSLGAGLMLLAALAIRTPMSRYPYGGQDQGTYVVKARMFARTGRIDQRSPLMARAEKDPALASMRLAYPRTSPGQTVPGRFEGFVYLGFYITDARSGRMVPQFFHLHPAWMTVVGWLYGPENGVWSLLLFAFLGLAAVWILARCVLEDRLAGLLAMGLLSVQILQVWTTRYPLSEIPAQGLWLCGVALLGKAVASDDADPWVAVVGGVCFGLTLFVRVTALFFIPVMLIGYLATPGGKTRKADAYRAFFWTAMVVMLWAAEHAVGFSYPYVFELFRIRLGYRLVVGSGTVLLLGGVCMAALVLVKEFLLDRFGRNARDRILDWAARHALILAGVVLLFVVGMLTWRHVGFPLFVKQRRWQFISRIVQLASFISWPGFVAGLLGLGLMGTRTRNPVAPFLFGFGMWFVLMVLVWEPYNRYAYYYCRYYVSELLPLLLLGAGVLVSLSFRHGKKWALVHTGWKRWSARALQVTAAVLIAFLAVSYVKGYFTNPTYRKQETRGAWAAVDNVVSQIPRHALVLMNRGVTAGQSAGFHLMLGTTLQFGYGYETLVLSRIGHLPKAVYERYPEVYLLEEDLAPRTDIADSRYMYLLVGGGVLPFRHSGKTLRPPTRYHPSWYRYFLYRVFPADRYTLDPRVRMPFSWFEGFEVSEKKHTWSRGRSRVVAPAPKGRVMEVTFRLSGIFPRRVTCPVTVWASGQVVHSKTYSGADLKHKRKVGPFRVPAHLNRGRLDLELETCTWQPSKVFGSHDRRFLGIDLKFVEIAAVEPGPGK
jgi:hypothetical protein